MKYTVSGILEQYKMESYVRVKAKLSEGHELSITIISWTIEKYHTQAYMHLLW